MHLYLYLYLYLALKTHVYNHFTRLQWSFSKTESMGRLQWNDQEIWRRKPDIRDIEGYIWSIHCKVWVTEPQYRRISKI